MQRNPIFTTILKKLHHHHHHHLHPWQLKVRATSSQFPHRRRVTVAAAVAVAVRRDHCRRDSVCAHQRHTKGHSGVVCIVAPQHRRPIGWNAPNPCLLISMWFLTPLVDHDHVQLLMITQIKPIYIHIVSYNYVFMCNFFISWYESFNCLQLSLLISSVLAVLLIGVLDWNFLLPCNPWFVYA